MSYFSQLQKRQNSVWSTTQNFSREKLWNDNFGSEMVVNWFVGLHDLLLMGLGQDQQQHPAVHCRPEPPASVLEKGYSCDQELSGLGVRPY